MYKLEFFYYPEYHAITNSFVQQFYYVSKKLDPIMKQSIRAKLWEIRKAIPLHIGNEEPLPEGSFIILNEREVLWLSEWLQLHINFNPKIAALKDRLISLETVPMLEAA